MWTGGGDGDCKRQVNWRYLGGKSDGLDVVRGRGWSKME